jgi:hypothetical protein
MGDIAPMPEQRRTALMSAGSRTLTVAIVVLDVHLSAGYFSLEGAL